MEVKLGWKCSDDKIVWMMEVLIGWIVWELMEVCKFMELWGGW